VANVDKPSHVRVRVLGCIVRVLTCFCNINKMYVVDRGRIQFVRV
jgi:hypothetical protein